MIERAAEAFLDLRYRVGSESRGKPRRLPRIGLRVERPVSLGLIALQCTEYPLSDIKSNWRSLQCSCLRTGLLLSQNLGTPSPSGPTVWRKTNATRLRNQYFAHYCSDCVVFYGTGFGAVKRWRSEFFPAQIRSVTPLLSSCS